MAAVSMGGKTCTKVSFPKSEMKMRCRLDSEEIIVRKKQKERVQKALNGWEQYQQMQRDAKLVYLKEKVQLQREMISKNDLLMEQRRKEMEIQRRQKFEEKRNEHRRLFQSIRQKELKLEEQRMKNKALASRDEDEKEQTEDVPVIAPQGRGGDDLHEVDSNNRLSYAGETSESADIEGRSRLAIMLRALGVKGQVELDFLWNKLASQKEQKLRKLEMQLQQLKDDPGMSPFLKQCLQTFELPYTNQTKYLWEDIRQEQIRGMSHQRRNSYPPVTTGGLRGRQLLSLMYTAALQNEHKASRMMNQKHFQQTIVDGSVSNIISEKNLEPISTVLKTLRRQFKTELDKLTTKTKCNGTVNDSQDTKKKAIFVVSNQKEHCQDLKEKKTSHLPPITEESVVAVAQESPMHTDCIRTWSAKSIQDQKLPFQGLPTKVPSRVDCQTGISKRKATWLPLDMNALTESKEVLVQNLGSGHYKHGAAKLWKTN